MCADGATAGNEFAPYAEIGYLKPCAILKRHELSKCLSGGCQALGSAISCPHDDAVIAELLQANENLVPLMTLLSLASS
jgi:hypothetical protein